mmetsp:Transcript_15286/g.37815  ORF Transcript_15286/g.37815 Transcript_15286/m.37815 type:complete len:250 (-) Transcript_15286:355-1104(-)
MASHAQCVAFSAHTSMTPAQSLRCTSPASTARATVYRYERHMLSDVYMSARWPCMSWNVPTGRLNWRRSCTYGATTSRHACMMPTGPAASTRRSRSRPLMSTAAPWFTPPSTLSAGTTQSSKMSSAVFEPRMPSLSSLRPVLKPAIVFSMMNAVMPCEPASGSVLAYTTSTSASGPLVIQNLLPLSTYAPSSRRVARSFIDTTSLPEPGSLMASAPTCSPAMSFGRYLAFCSGVPLRDSWLMHRFEHAP